MADENSCKKRLRNDSSESEIESSEAKKLRDDLLEFLNDSDSAPSMQELDSVMKSLQEEISASSSTSVRVTSDSGESQAQIGYLLEASDDELGLPPPGYPSVHEVVNEEKKDETDLARVLSDSSGIGELWEFENRIPSYDSFDLGNGFGGFGYDSFDGIFNHSDVYYDSNEFSDSWRHGTLPAQ
ncbi:unnamed protein product [Lathyrus sativus]|nr:unnamed protein product [Lathyrus sativus]